MNIAVNTNVPLHGGQLDESFEEESDPMEETFRPLSSTELYDLRPGQILHNPMDSRFFGRGRFPDEAFERMVMVTFVGRQEKWVNCVTVILKSSPWSIRNFVFGPRGREDKHVPVEAVPQTMDLEDVRKLQANGTPYEHKDYEAGIKNVTVDPKLLRIGSSPANRMWLPDLGSIYHHMQLAGEDYTANWETPNRK